MKRLTSPSGRDQPMVSTSLFPVAASIVGLQMISSTLGLVIWAGSSGLSRYPPAGARSACRRARGPRPWAKAKERLQGIPE